MKRSNKIHNADLFTQAATEQYHKHIRTQSKQALQRINETVNRSALIQPLEQRLSFDLARNKLQFVFSAAVYNIRKMLSLNVRKHVEIIPTIA